ncbi:hypothetical protein WN51_02129 [Melipona quadrifasciata]|uniref:SUEL-type lectin domain-containing protein n=1 Tax=Melipona quadrifasciata TaxID=166423 RepID=A0A0M8ZTB9_9HYME|nr:hypothetical protein WN51_02129 [Melipona quadrifasciata]
MEQRISVGACRPTMKKEKVGAFLVLVGRNRSKIEQLAVRKLEIPFFFVYFAYAILSDVSWLNIRQGGSVSTNGLIKLRLIAFICRRHAATVVDVCHKKRQCKFNTSPKTFQGDPCPGLPKYIEVAYQCRPSSSSTEDNSSYENLEEFDINENRRKNREISFNFFGASGAIPIATEAPNRHAVPSNNALKYVMCVMPSPAYLASAGDIRAPRQLNRFKGRSTAVLCINQTVLRRCASASSFSLLRRRFRSNPDID